MSNLREAQTQSWSLVINEEVSTRSQGTAEFWDKRSRLNVDVIPEPV